jgi:hypothetical protein
MTTHEKAIYRNGILDAMKTVTNLMKECKGEEDDSPVITLYRAHTALVKLYNK